MRRMMYICQLDLNAFQKFAKKILRFANSIFRITLPGLAPLSGLLAHLPAPATSEAAPQGFQGPGSQAPILPVPPADGHCEDQAWHRKQSQISEH